MRQDAALPCAKIPSRKFEENFDNQDKR